MKKNMGNVDRVFRLFLAAVLAALYFTDTVPGTTGLVLLVLGVVFLITSFIGVCPLYLPFGIKTFKTTKN